jgi:putative PIN family toxin of toxin-antitoxin system
MTATRQVMRVVIDTNVVLSALVFTQGRLVPLRQAWQQGRCCPLVSTPTAAELIRALQYPKFKLSSTEQEELLADYLPYCATVSMPAKLPQTPPCRDPFDIPFLQLALVSKADHLVTGDKDLLGLASVFARSILTAEQLLGLLAKD